MKKFIIIFILLFSALTITYYIAEARGGKCTGSKYCSACKNCKYCKHCAKDGGSCGKCK